MGEQKAVEPKRYDKIEECVYHILPISMNLDSKNVVLFRNGQSPFSTFHKAQVKILTASYPCVECYYQACKIRALCGLTALQRLVNVKSGAEAKLIAREIIKEHKVGPLDVLEWKRTLGVKAVYFATAYKFLQNPHLRRELFKTGNKLIVHSYYYDEFYASGCDERILKSWLKDHHGKRLEIGYSLKVRDHIFPTIGNGQNIVGFINMLVRESLKKEYPDEWAECSPSYDPREDAVHKMLRDFGRIL
uniref:NADAR domain-containing protein n=1 Tax=Panagrolaimus sp. JU765 TaxID=591449 RepID=A0AC34QTB9_9BILA